MDIDTWEIVAVVISSLFVVGACGVGLWWLFRSGNDQSPTIRPNTYKRVK